MSLYSVARFLDYLELDDGAEEDCDAVEVLRQLLARLHLLDDDLGQHLVGELVADGLLLLHGLRPLVDVHGEVVRGGDGAPGNDQGLRLHGYEQSCSPIPNAD